MACAYLCEVVGMKTKSWHQTVYIEACPDWILSVERETKPHILIPLGQDSTV